MEQTSSRETNSHSASKLVRADFYGTWIFFTEFTRDRHWYLSWVRWIQTTPIINFKAQVFRPVPIQLSSYVPSPCWFTVQDAFRQSTPCHPISSGCILILPPPPLLSLDLARGHFPSGFLTRILSISHLPCVLHVPPTSSSLIWSHW